MRVHLDETVCRQIRKIGAMGANDYESEIHLLRSTLIVSSLQKRNDLRAQCDIQEYAEELDWEPLSEHEILPEAWKHVEDLHLPPRLVFCHWRILSASPSTSLYYRGLSGLSRKLASKYSGASIDAAEKGTSRQLAEDRARRIACVYNRFVCSVIEGCNGWTMDDGHRTIVATLGITLDGSMRNRIGTIAEDRIRRLVLAWLLNQNAIVSPDISDVNVVPLPHQFVLATGIEMSFASEPDISFLRDGELLAVVEIKGGTDPAGALERYGAATKSFQHAIASSARCRNFYLSAVITPELARRIETDRLVEHTFSIVKILDDPHTRNYFFTELFHHTLRLV